MSRIAAALTALAVVAATSLALSDPAAAHERRNVGKYELVVGWIGEPAFAGTINAVDLRVTDPSVTPPKAVEGLEKTLKVSVTHAGLTRPLELEFRTRFGMPGAYAADMVPTREGEYTFHIVGRIEALDVDEKFESGPGRFGSVEPLTALQYPEKVPTGADLARRLGDLQATADQVRLISLLAVVLAAAALAAPLVLRRRG
jgi:hypothetical protein